MTKMQNLVNTVSGAVIGRDELVLNCVYGMLTGLNVLSYGPPGTAKSLTSRLLCVAIGGKVFIQQLDPMLEKEDLFGPPSLKALDEDRWERKIEGYAPTADILHFDEVDRGGRAIEGAMLTLLNEKKFKNGTSEIDVPALLIVGTTNGRIQDAASWDRWAIKVYTPYIGSDPEALSKLVNYKPSDVTQVIDLDDIREAREKVRDVTLHSSLANEGHRIATQIASKLDYYVSDRKWTQIVQVMRASAFIDGRSETRKSDWWAARNLLWDDIESITVIDAIITQIAGIRQENVAVLQGQLDSIRNDFEALMNNDGIGYVEKASSIASLMVRLNMFNSEVAQDGSDEIATRIADLRSKLTAAAMGQ